jgi:hypothetical protein
MVVQLAVLVVEVEVAMALALVLAVALEQLGKVLLVEAVPREATLYLAMTNTAVQTTALSMVLMVVAVALVVLVGSALQALDWQPL